MAAGERGRIRLDDLIGDDDDVAIAAITVAELLVGVELADAAHRPGRKALLDSIIATVPMTLSLKNLLPILALILGVASLVAPRFLNVFVAVFLIAFAVFGLGLIR